MRKKVVLIVLITMCYLPAQLMAQPDLGDGGDDTQDVPFDGGVTILIAAGMAYGLKKAFYNKKQNYGKF